MDILAAQRRLIDEDIDEIRYIVQSMDPRVAAADCRFLIQTLENSAKLIKNTLVDQSLWGPDTIPNMIHIISILQAHIAIIQTKHNHLPIDQKIDSNIFNKLHNIAHRIITLSIEYITSKTVAEDGTIPPHSREV